MPLMQAVRARRTNRAFARGKLASQTLSDVLWAACGDNRSTWGGRTAPSAHGTRDIDAHAMLEEGVDLYQARARARRSIGGPRPGGRAWRAPQR